MRALGAFLTAVTVAGSCFAQQPGPMQPFAGWAPPSPFPNPAAGGFMPPQTAPAAPFMPGATMPYAGNGTAFAGWGPPSAFPNPAAGGFMPPQAAPAAPFMPGATMPYVSNGAAFPAAPMVPGAPGGMTPPSPYGAAGLGGSPPAGAPSATGFANEAADFGVPPQANLQANVGSPTPTSIPGGQVVTTVQLVHALQSRTPFVLVDALNEPTHPTLPGAHRIPEAGSPGSLGDQIELQLKAQLDQLTGNQPEMPIIFFCQGASCWESYNAALRAAHLGYRKVYWYRGGLAAWRAAGLPTVEAATGNGGMGTGPMTASPIGNGMFGTGAR